MADDVKTNEDELGMDGEHTSDAGDSGNAIAHSQRAEVNGYHASADADDDDELLVAADETEGTTSEGGWDEDGEWDGEDEGDGDDSYRWDEDSDERGLFDESELDATDAGEDDDLDDDDDDDDLEDDDDQDADDDLEDDDDDDYDAVVDVDVDNAAVRDEDEDDEDDVVVDLDVDDAEVGDEDHSPAAAEEEPLAAAEDEETASAAADDTNVAATHDGQAETTVAPRVSDPGAQHAMLAALEGTWDTITRVWVAPSVPELELAGEAERTWLFDGRFLKEERSTHVPEDPSTSSDEQQDDATANADSAADVHLDAERPEDAPLDASDNTGASETNEGRGRGRGRQRGGRRGRDRSRDKTQLLMRSAPRGLAFWGHDNATGRFQGTFMSNNSTAQVHFAGTADEATQTIVFMGAEPDPSGRGPTRNFKLVLTIDDETSHRLTQYYVQRNGRELQSFEIAYKRRTVTA